MALLAVLILSSYLVISLVAVIGMYLEKGG